MNRIKSIGVAALAAAMLAGASARVSAGDLTTAKSLYASASYEEALAQLSALGADTDVEQIEQYRALCLLALGRTSDAEQSLREIVQRKPLHKLEDAEVSPKLVAMFQEVRRTTLPAVAKGLYGKAKADFDAKDFGRATAGFQELLAIVRDPDAAGDQAAYGDLQQLGEGFLTLSESAAVSVSARNAMPAAAPPAAVAPAPSKPAAPVAAYYSAADLDVTPPIPLDQTIPKWVPPTGPLAKAVLTGRVEVVVDERGRIESSSLITPITAFYDFELLEATKRWRYRPATRNGQPVKFRKLLDIVLRPAGSLE